MPGVDYLDDNLTTLDNSPQLPPELQVLLVRSHHSPSFLLEQSQLSPPVQETLIFLLKDQPL